MLCRDWLCLLQINFSILKIIFAHLYDFFTSHNTRWSRCTNSLWLNHIKCSHFQLSYPAFLFIFISRFLFFIPHMKNHYLSEVEVVCLISPFSWYVKCFYPMSTLSFSLLLSMLVTLHLLYNNV